MHHRHPQSREVADHGAHPFDVLGLAAEVELAVQRLGQVLEHRLHVHHLFETGAIRHLLGEHLEQREVLFDLLLRIGPLDLHHGLRVIGERRSVHLRDRPGGERERLDRLEHVLPRDAELLLHHAHDLFLGQGRNVVLEGRELLDELGRHEVRTCRQDLAQLGERGSELLERAPQALGLASAADGSLLVGSAEQLLQPMLGEDRRDLRAARDQVRLGLGLDGARADRGGGPRDRGDRSVARRVHDDHRAARVVADPVGDVAEEELLAPGHTGVAHDQDVDVVLLRGVHDREAGSSSITTCARPRSPAMLVAYSCSSSAAARARVTSAVPCSVSAGWSGITTWTTCSSAE